MPENTDGPTESPERITALSRRLSELERERDDLERRLHEEREKVLAARRRRVWQLGEAWADVRSDPTELLRLPRRLFAILSGPDPSDGSDRGDRSSGQEPFREPELTIDGRVMDAMSPDGEAEGWARTRILRSEEAFGGYRWRRSQHLVGDGVVLTDVVHVCDGLPRSVAQRFALPQDGALAPVRGGVLEVSTEGARWYLESFTGRWTLEVDPAAERPVVAVNVVAPTTLAQLVVRVHRRPGP